MESEWAGGGGQRRREGVQFWKKWRKGGRGLSTGVGAGREEAGEEQGDRQLRGARNWDGQKGGVGLNGGSKAREWVGRRDAVDGGGERRGVMDIDGDRQWEEL